MAVEAFGDLAAPTSNAVEPGVQLDDLPDAELCLEARRLELHAHLGLGLSRVSLDVDAVDQHRPRLGFEQALDGAERARLARTVGAEKTEDLSAVDMKAHIVDGLRGPVGHGEIADIQDGVLTVVGRCCSPRVPSLRRFVLGVAMTLHRRTAPRGSAGERAGRERRSRR